MPVPKLCTQTRSNTGSQAQRRTQTVDRNDRTPEQHMADVAACTLGRLADLSEELDHLQRQLEMLAGWAADHPDVDYKSLVILGDDVAGFGVLGGVIETLAALRCWVPELVRDIAATLPIRGLEYR
jgi:hypothetical protein